MRILVAAPHPALSTQSEGMMQRVAEIDRFLRASFPDGRVDYLQLSYRQRASRLEDRSTESFMYAYNVFTDVGKINVLLDNYDVIYVHSVYNYQNLWPFLIGSHHLVIADLHGVVPDEERFSGRPVRGTIFDVLERVWLKRAQVIVAVTQSMVEYFRRKHDHMLESKKQYILLPVFDDVLAVRAVSTSVRDKVDMAIYAGGLQPWQNVPLVAQAIPKLAQRGFVTECYFPAHHRSEVQKQMVEEIGRMSGLVGTLPRDELFKRYEQASLGFLLRDDVTVNRVSSPTKLNEYLAFGIVPILLQAQVGDFALLGYHYLRFDDLMTGILPGRRELNDMARDNLKLYQVQLERGAHGKAQLRRAVGAARR